MDYYYEQPMIGERYLGSGEYVEDVLYFTSEIDSYVLDSILNYVEECRDGEDALQHILERIADDFGISFAQEPNVSEEDIVVAPYPVHYN